MKRTMIVLAILIGVAGARSVSAQEFVLVVNPANQATTLSKSEVSDLFLKKNVTWSGGQAVVVVDLLRTSSVRDAFSQAVHGRAVSAVANYWQQQIFSGKSVPPPEKADDGEVLAFVKSTPGGIGYVSASADLTGVKKVALK